MATTTQTAVIDLLVQKFQGLSLVVGGQPVNVYDGPEGPDEEDNYIVVMGWPDDSTGAKLEWAYLGDRSRYENYSLAVCVFCYVGGDDSTASMGTEDAQATARANARTLQAALEQALLSDPNLSIQCGGIAPILWILMSNVAYSQTMPDEEEDEGMGRYAQFIIKCDVFNLLGGG